MSRAKELAREIEDKYSRSKIWDMNIDSDISDIVYLAIDLSRKILSEPEPLRGWIEVTFMRKSDPNNNENKALLDVKTIKMICFDSDLRKVGIEFHNQVDTCFHVQESYDEIKNKIARAG